MTWHRITTTLALAGALIGAAPLAGASNAAAQLKVVTSTTDLYDIAKEVGGNKITATHIGEGYQDPHFIEAKPSFVLQLRNADVWAFVGLVRRSVFRIQLRERFAEELRDPPPVLGVQPVVRVA